MRQNGWYERPEPESSGSPSPVRNNGRELVTEDNVRELLSTLDGVRVVMGSESVGTPRSHWGDAFCFYDPDCTADQKLPFATNVTHDTPGWDEVSNLDRPGAFRVSLAAGRAHQPQADGASDFSEADVVLPHPQYAAQGWIAIVSPSSARSDELRELIGIAYRRAVDRHRGRRPR